MFRLETALPSWQQWWHSLKRHWSWGLGAQLLLGAIGVCSTAYGWWHVYLLRHQPPCQWPEVAEVAATTDAASFTSTATSTTSSFEATNSTTSANSSHLAADSVTVYITGAVRQPGLVTLPQGSRVAEAIDQAGGLDAQADSQYVAQQLNLAQKLSDQLSIYIPFRSDSLTGSQSFPQSSTKPNPLSAPTASGSATAVNLNFATEDQLQQLPGIGEKRASDIAAGRPYSVITELLDRGIVSKAVFEGLTGLITL